MFTVEQIKAAHSKIKSGADFQTFYIRRIIEEGLKVPKPTTESEMLVFAA